MEMSPKTFRGLVAADFLIGVGSVLAPFLPSSISAPLAEAYANEPSVLDTVLDPLGMPQLILVAAGLLALIAASYYGLYQFRRWGRTLWLGMTVAFVALTPFSGPHLYSGIEDCLGSVMLLLDGALIALAYCAPAIRDCFEGKPASNKLP